jgi:transposase
MARPGAGAPVGLHGMWRDREHNPILMEFCKRLADKRLAEMAIVVAAMRKLTHIVFGVLKNKQPFDPNYGKQFTFNP